MLDPSYDKSNIPDVQFIDNGHTRHKCANFNDLEGLLSCHHLNLRSCTDLPVHYAHIDDNPFIRIVVRVKDQRFKRLF
ncbi:hypothetical protein D3C78_1484850 [compost metagenome]